jgi:cyclophilin family peptidyl-prolyl cis-trans isomerase
MRHFVIAATVLALALALGCKKKEPPKPDAGPPVAAVPSIPPAEARRVVLETNAGKIEIELFRAKAPKGVENFTKYAARGTYDGTIVHRVVAGTVIQGGGYDRKFQKRPTDPPIPNEATKTLKNLRGTVAWARTDDPHSATTQFFINLKDNPSFDHRSRTAAGFGYAVFGKVVRGMEAVDKIGDVAVEPRGIFPSVPVDTVLIERVRLLR